ncbi:histidine kinase [Halobiforma lacisalsi AJ5]|uniref:histidine kinase n=1 Tax=Natronobacterium lacisalsi AJ5 TaxID=358396 RepID=M0LWD6_NATLA|nr:PAS domain S-box protein [Halobiforma lacisalsi]APW96247.1 histidine kinase [Halobiforma lacisalsi AJ5]EMA36410.1 multi-sensor signal transduction histidine kinase [Halobiforma lacisalsi AJ5]
MPSLRVLYVDGESALEPVGHYLESETDAAEFEVRTEASVDDALAALERVDVDCIVCGTGLDVDPLSVLRAVRSYDRTVPFVLFADEDGASAETISDAFAAGVTDYVRKGNQAAEEYEVLARRIEAASREESELSLGPERVEEAIDHAADAVFVTDTDGRIEYANDAFEGVTGFSTSEAIGRNPRILKSGEQGQSYYERMWNAILDGEVWEEEVVNERKSGDRYFAHQTIAPIVGEDGTVEKFVAIQRDVTDRRRLEQEIERSATTLSRLHDVAFEPNRPVDEKLERLLEIGTESLAFPIGYVTRIEDGTQRIVAAIGDHGLLQEGATDPLEQTYCRHTLEADDPVVVTDAANEPEWESDPAFERFGLRCYVGAKIVVEGDVYGTVCFASEEPRTSHVGQVQQSTVKALAQWVGHELERRRYERDLERYEEIIENVPVGVFRSTPGEEGTFLEVNDAMVEMFDAPSKAALLERPPTECYRNPGRRAEFSEALTEHGELRNEVIELETFEGDPFYGSLSAIERRDGEDIYFDGILQDVTERERTKAELARSRERLQVLFDQSPDAIIVHDSDGCILDVNEKQIEQTGYDRDELLSMNVGDVETGISLPELRRIWEDLEPGSVLEVEGKHRRRDGSTYPVEIWVSCIELDDERRFLALSREITERKERERNLELAHTQLRQVIDLVPDLIFAKNRDGEYILANETVADVYGRSLEEIEGKTDAELLESAAQADAFRVDDREVIESMEPKHVPEEELTAADGRTLFIETTKIPFEVAGTGEPAVLGYARDVTELKEQRDRLDLLNQVVRHDVRNDMQVVKGRAQLLADRLSGADTNTDADANAGVDLSDAEEHLSEVLESAEEAIELTKTARDLTETMLERDDERRPVALPQVLTSRIDAIRARYSDARISLEGPVPDVSVVADDMLTSVVDNLLVNAIVHNDAAEPRVTASADVEDDRVVLRVADNGPGIPDSRKAEVFGKGETDIDSPGTGLGLYLVRTLVEQYGGDVWVEDNDPEGSVFTVSLRLAGDRE